VVVTQVQAGSIAAMAGIKAGAVILQVDRHKVCNAVEFKRLIKKSSKDIQILLLIRDDEFQHYVVLNW